MHIAVVAPEFPPEIGGMQTYAVEFARELARRGHRVTVLTRQRTVPQPAFAGMEIRGVLVGRYATDLAQLRKVRADAWQVMNAAYAWVALHFTPTVVSVHGNDFLRPYIPVGEPDLSRVPLLWRAGRLCRMLERRLGERRTSRLVQRGLESATQVLANSHYTEQVFLQHFPACAGRTCAAMVGVGTEYLHDRSPKAPNAVKRLITVCRLSERRKNVDLVLRALAVLKGRHDFRFTVVGDGELRAELEQLTDALGLRERVEFAGLLPADELRARLVQSDLFVLPASVNPASHEGFGIAYLEANACGTPTLAARLAGAAEAVDEGVSGFFVADVSVEATAEALGRFLGSEVAFSPQACRAFARRFSWATVVDAALPWYGAAALGSGLAGSVQGPAHA